MDLYYYLIVSYHIFIIKYGEKGLLGEITGQILFSPAQDTMENRKKSKRKRAEHRFHFQVDDM